MHVMLSNLCNFGPDCLVHFVSIFAGLVRATVTLITSALYSGISSERSFRLLWGFGWGSGRRGIVGSSTISTLVGTRGVCRTFFNGNIVRHIKVCQWRYISLALHCVAHRSYCLMRHTRCLFGLQRFYSNRILVVWQRHYFKEEEERILIFCC